MCVRVCVRVCASVPNSLSYLPASAHKLVRIEMRACVYVRVCVCVSAKLLIVPAGKCSQTCKD